MPATERPLNHYVTVALAREQYQFLVERVDAGKALNVPDAIRQIIDRSKECASA